MAKQTADKTRGEKMKRGMYASAILVLASQLAASSFALGQTAEEKNQLPGGTLVAEKDAPNSGAVDFTESARIKAAKTPSGENTASAKMTDKAPSNWSGSIESRNEYVAATVNTGEKNGADPETYLMTRLNYSLNSNLRLGVGFDFDHNFFNANSAKEMRNVDLYSYDPFVRVTVPSLAKLPGDINLTVEARAYAPLSEYAAASGAKALRAYVILAKDSGNWSFNYLANPRMYINSKTVYQIQNPDGSYKNSNTTAARLIQQLEAAYKFNDKFSVYQDLGVDDRIVNGANLNGTDRPGSESSNEILETGMNFTPNATFRVTAGLSSYEHDYRTQGFTLYGPATRYFVSGAAAF